MRDIQAVIRVAVVCAGLALGASGAVITYVGGASGDWDTPQNWSPNPPAAGDDVLFNASTPAAVYLNASKTVRQINVTGTGDVTLNVNNGVTLAISNTGGWGIQVDTANLTITGAGRLALSTVAAAMTDLNHLDNGVAPGFTLTIDTQIVDLSGGNNTGFETWRNSNGAGGTLVLTNPNNAFAMNFNMGAKHVVVASALANAGLPCPLGACAGFCPSRDSVLRYTGPAVTTDRAFLLNGGDATHGIGGSIEQAGSGVLTWGGPIYNMANIAQTLTLLGDAAHEGRVTGAISNAVSTLAVAKSGSGTWVLAGDNSFTGGLTINAGTLGLASANAAGNVAQIAMASGATLAVNPSATPGFAAAFPPIASMGSIALAVGANTDVTFGGLSAVAAAITAPGIGADTRIFITGFPTGVVGPWLTLNGGAARYDTVNGLTPVAVATQYLATKNNPLPNGGTVEAVINAIGTGPDIWLAANPTTLFSLTMAEAGDAAVVNLAGQTLMAAEVAVAAGAAGLTIGAAPQDGAFLPPGIVLPAPPDSGIVAALDPLIWYDPSDAGTVTFATDGTIAGLANKGASGTMYDAAPRSDHTGPLYATGLNSHAPLPTIKIDANTQSLQSQSLTGIAGDVGRTLIAVMSHVNAENYVYMGANKASQDFSIRIGIVANNNRFIRFNSYAGDLDVAAPPVETPAVLSFWNGVDEGSGVQLNRLQAAVDGVLTAVWSPNSSVLDTVDSTLRLGYQESGNAGRGQIGEVLLFDRTLTAQERKAVEDYLMAKWKSPSAAPAVPQQTASLTLRNESAAPLTLNAALNTPYDSVVSLMKIGAGDVTLAGGVSLSGPVLLDAGALTVATPADAIDTFFGTFFGAGKLVKDGPGALTLPIVTANQHTGGTDILGGIVRIGNSRSLSTGEVVIDGGTLDIGGGIAADSIVINNRFTLSGDGAGGKGAIVNNGPFQQRNAFQNTTLTLADDASIGGASVQRWDLSGLGVTLDLNGHTLTKKGVADFRISPAVVSNAPAGTAFHIEEGHLGIESSTVLEPNDSLREILIEDGGRFGLYNLEHPVNWTIVPRDGGTVWAFGSDQYTNKNVLASGISLDSGVTLHLTAAGAYGKNLTGEISGPGGLSIHDGGRLAMSLLSHPANTFTGPVAVTNATLGLRHPGSLPGGIPAGLANLSLAPNGSGVRVYAGADGWSPADVLTLAASPHFNASAVDSQWLQVHVGEGEAVDIPDVSGTFTGSLSKFGTGTLSWNGDLTLVNGFARVYAGTLILTNDATFNVGTGHFMVGDTALSDGTTDGIKRLHIGGDAQVICTDLGFNISANALAVGYHAGRGVLDVTDNAFVQSRVFAGGWDISQTNACGAIYQSGGHWRNTGGANNDSRIGRWGYGYYQLDGGEMFIKGWSILGGATVQKSVGIFRQTGGSFLFNGGNYTTVPPNGTLAESYTGAFDISRGGTGILHLEGGEFFHYGYGRILAYDDSGNTNGLAVMTVSGTAAPTYTSYIDMGGRPNGAAILNLNAGKLTTTYIRRLNRASTVAVNFNGGALCVTNNAGNASLFALEAAGQANDQIGLYVYPGGATVELGEGVTRAIDFPLEKPAGLGIAAIALNAAGSGYIAPPHVSITGGGGSGATAIARIDRERGEVTGIEVTSPGSGYTALPSVTLIGGGGTSIATAGLVTRAGFPAGGGLTKTGPGTLILNAANTYDGPTRVDAGTLRIAHPAAISPASDIIIGDGLLDLGGHTFTVPSVTLTGSGGIVNGKVITISAVKTGPGTAIWDAAIEFISAPPTPGLWEGMIKGSSAGDYWDMTTPNPRFTVQLGTEAGNYGPRAVNTTYAEGRWNGNYHTWVYTGYIWNNDPTNVTWTWRFSFDDNVALWIDGNLVRNNALANGVQYTNYLLSPGAHPIEVRLGDGTGDVGPVSGAGGLMYDPLGRNFQSADNNVLPEYYSLLADPGDGTLLTTTPAPALTTGAIRVLDGTLLLPSSASVAGLWEGMVRAAWDMATPNPHESVQLTTRAGNGGPAESNATYNNGMWAGDNHTWIYTGYIWNRSGATQERTWRFTFDDNVALWIDGNLIRNNLLGDGVQYADYALTPGPHAIEVRFGDGIGSVGPASGAGGLTYSAIPGSMNVNDYILLADPGDGSLLTTHPYSAGPDLLDGITFDLAPGATLDLGGQPRDNITVTGSGAVVNGAPGSGGLILSPGGDDRTAALSVDGFNNGSLNGVTYRLTVHDFPPGHYDNPPGLWEGHIPYAAWDTHTPNPRDGGIQQEPRAGRVIYGNNTTGDPARNFFWAGNSNTWVYTGFVWNHAPADVTWTWRFNFDDDVALWLDGILIRHATWNHVAIDNCLLADTTLTPGPHAIEIRFGDGTGNVGPANAAASGLMYDPLGRGSADLGDYIVLENDGIGLPLLTVTAFPAPGPACDLLTSAGALDLTGLTIIPSDVISGAPPAPKYLIATAAALTGTPAVEGFTDGRKWKTLKQGGNLWLTTQGGTILILR